jgi:hypothetical protein
LHQSLVSGRPSAASLRRAVQCTFQQSSRMAHLRHDECTPKPLRPAPAHLRQVLDNTALDAMQQQLGIEQLSVEQGNSLVSIVMAAATAPFRFPGAAALLSCCHALSALCRSGPECTGCREARQQHDMHQWQRFVACPGRQAMRCKLIRIVMNKLFRQLAPLAP